jgi:hypothetical protein
MDIHADRWQHTYPRAATDGAKKQAISGWRLRMTVGHMRWIRFTVAVWVSCCLAVAQPAHAAEGIPDSAWFHHSLVGMEVGPTGAQFGHSDPNDARYCSQFNGREIVRRCVSANCDYLVIWARDGDYAYYDSALLPKAPGLGTRNPLRETVAEAARHGLPVIAYCVVQQGGHYLREHPEFEMRDPADNRIG